jgi:putative peptide zinc metalloprotease protein
MQLKSEVHWIRHPDGYWILRNPQFVTFLQVDELDKRIICQLGKINIQQIIAEYNVSLDDIQELLQMLAATGMLEGTQPPVKKFKLSQILYFKVPLFKPDRWLTQIVHQFKWVWTENFAIILAVFFIQTIIVWFLFANRLILTHNQVWGSFTQGNWTPIFKLLGFSLLVILFHELGHALTLKHYGGIVPEIGLLCMGFIPGFYTNTTDQYCLISRRKRVLVVAAGIIMQLIIWAIAFWLFLFAPVNSELKQNSYLLMTASLLTVILNLNPLNKFDGYYLLVAGTGINNLRARSLEFYQQLFRREHSSESPANQITLFFYTPLSLVYTFWILDYLVSILRLWLSENSSLIFDFYSEILFH